MVNSGVPVNQAIDIIGQTLTGKMKQVCRDIHKRLVQGVSIAETFSEHPNIFPEYFLGIIVTGEKNNDLDSSLELLKKKDDREFTFQKRLKSLSLYPRILFLLATAYLFFFFFVILPEFYYLSRAGGTNLVFDNVIFGNIFKCFINLSIYFKRAGTELLLYGIGVVLFFFILSRFRVFRIDNNNRVFLKYKHWFRYGFPFIGTIRKCQDFTVFFESLGNLLEKGTPLDQSWIIATKNVYFYKVRRQLESAVKSIQKGESLHNIVEMVDWPSTYITSSLRFSKNIENLADTCYDLVSYLEKMTETHMRVYIYIIPLFFLVLPIVSIMSSYYYLWNIIHMLSG